MGPALIPAFSVSGFMKAQQNTLRIFALAAVCLLAVGGYLWYRYLHPVKPPPEGPGVYYMGPMRSKGNPNVWGTEDGRRASPPPGVPALPAGTGGGLPRPGGQ